jgi:hypothetical protein
LPESAQAVIASVQHKPKAGTPARSPFAFSRWNEPDVRHLGEWYFSAESPGRDMLPIQAEDLNTPIP